MNHAQTLEIVTLDKITSPNTKSLRTLLMNIKTKDKKSNFLGVNEDAQGDGVSFSFLTALKTEACNMILYSGTYLVHKHAKGVLKYFKHNAAKHAKEAT